MQIAIHITMMQEEIVDSTLIATEHEMNATWILFVIHSLLQQRIPCTFSSHSV